MKLFESLVKKTFSEIQKSFYQTAFVELTEDLAIASARQIDQLTESEQQKLPLIGKIFSVKDNINLQGYKSSVGNPYMPILKASMHSVVVRNLLNAGAICIGKNHMNEFAAGLDGLNVHYKDLLNPVFSNALTGGSSSGGAVAVSAGLVDFAIGSDTGGSARVPACWNGIFGFRLPTSESDLDGLFPRSPTLDAIGVLAGRPELISSVYSALKTNSHCHKLTSSKNCKIGIVSESLAECAPGTQAMFYEALKNLQSTFCFSDLALPELREVNEASLAVLLFEFREVFLTRFPDQSFSFETLGPQVRSDLIRAKTISLPQRDNAISIIKKFSYELNSLMSDLDLIMMPLCRQPAPNRTEKYSGDDLRAFTLPWSAAGYAVLAIPTIAIDSENNRRPDGIQLIAKPEKTDILLSVGNLMKELLHG